MIKKDDMCKNLREQAEEFKLNLQRQNDELNIKLDLAEKSNQELEVANAKIAEEYVAYGKLLDKLSEEGVESENQIQLL